MIGARARDEDKGQPEHGAGAVAGRLEREAPAANDAMKPGNVASSGPSGRWGAIITPDARNRPICSRLW